MAPLLHKANGVNATHTISPVPNLWIAGLGSQYPPHLLGPERLEEIAKRFYDADKPG